MTTRTVVIGGLGLGVVLISGTAFLNKMIDFALTISGHQIEGFGAVAVTTYLLGMVPIVCVMLWAIFTGRFADVEGPKFRMLELQNECEARADGGASGGYHEF